MTSEVTDDGSYKLRHHTRASLCFEGVEELQAVGFNNQNALLGIAFEDISSRQLEWLKWEVRFEAAHGLDASLLCRAIRVEGVEPFEPRRRTSSPYGRQSGPRPL
jgi:hypothetical protein